MSSASNLAETKGKVYLAGPQVFSLYGERFIQEKLMPALEDAGYEPIFPKEIGDDRIVAINQQPLSMDRVKRHHDWARETGRRNAEAVEEADVVLANLDRPTVDDGTSFEASHAIHTDTPVVGYRTDPRRSGENEGVIVNLQAEHYLVEEGGNTIIAPDPYGGAWEPDGYRFYSDPGSDNLIDVIIEELDAALEEA